MDRLNQWLTLLANLGVIAGIVFLAFEIQQNTNALRSASYEHWNEVSSDYYDFYAAYANELSDIERVEDADQLQPAQQKILMALVSRAVIQAETAFLLHRAGSLDDDVFEARMRAFRTFLTLYPLGHGIWQMRKVNSPEDFVRYLETRIPELGQAPQ